MYGSFVSNNSSRIFHCSTKHLEPHRSRIRDQKSTVQHSSSLEICFSQIASKNGIVSDPLLSDWPTTESLESALAHSDMLELISILTFMRLIISASELMTLRAGICSRVMSLFPSKFGPPPDYALQTTALSRVVSSLALTYCIDTEHGWSSWTFQRL